MNWATRIGPVLFTCALSAGQAWAWTLPAPVLTTGQDSLDPRMSVDSSGKAHVVWRERISGGYFDIWYSDNTQGLFSAPLTLSQGSGVGAGSPVVCANAGDLHTAWIASPAGDFEIWYRKQTAGVWGPIYNASNTSIKSLRPALGARGNVGPVVAWDEAIYADDNYDTFFSEWTGAGFSSAINISNTAGGAVYGSVNVNLAVSPNGDVTVVWADRISGDYHVNARRRVGGVWQPRQELSTYQTGPSTPGIVAGADSRVHVVYEAQGTIWYQVWNGSSWSSPVGLPGGLNSVARPRVTVDENGVAYVVADAYTDSNNNRDVFYTTNFSGSWSAWADISNTTGTQSLNGDIGYGAGALTIIWQENSNGLGGTAQYNTWYVVGPKPSSGPAGTVAGTVYDGGGLPLAGATVTLGSAYQTATAANGTYTLSGVTPGGYTAVASKLYYAPRTVTGISVVANSTTTVNFTISTAPPDPVSSITATPANAGNLLNWTNPSDGNFVGTIIRAKTTGYPTSPTDGTLVADRPATPGSSDFFIHSGLTNGVTYYYTAFAYSGTASHIYAAGTTAHATPFGPADFNHDGDADQEDFGVMQICLTGSYVPQVDPACGQAMLDGDNDVDLDDVNLFIPCLSGPGVPASPTCIQ